MSAPPPPPGAGPAQEAPRRRQHREGHRQGDDSQVLGHQEPQGHPPVQGLQLPLASSTFTATTVLERASKAPRKIPAPKLKPRAGASNGPRAMVPPICSAPPTPATRPRRRSSESDSSAPTANIRKATPTSARASTACGSTWGPGVNGPRATPARR